MEALKLMRSFSKALVIAAGLLSIGMYSSTVRANTALAGNFTLAHATRWKNTVLPAGEYRFTLARTQTDTNRLVVRGKNQSFVTLVFAQSACESCKAGALTLNVEGDNRSVSALELPGYHVDFNTPQLKSVRGEEANKARTNPEQVAVHVDSN
jgi:hypothetical protein